MHLVCLWHFLSLIHTPLPAGEARCCWGCLTPSQDASRKNTCTHTHAKVVLGDDRCAIFIGASLLHRGGVRLWPGEKTNFRTHFSTNIQIYEIKDAGELRSIHIWTVIQYYSFVSVHHHNNDRIKMCLKCILSGLIYIWLKIVNEQFSFIDHKYWDVWIKMFEFLHCSVHFSYRKIENRTVKLI